MVPAMKKSDNIPIGTSDIPAPFIAAREGATLRDPVGVEDAEVLETVFDIVTKPLGSFRVAVELAANVDAPYSEGKELVIGQSTIEELVELSADVSTSDSVV